MLTRRRVLATAAIALVPTAVAVVWACADRIVPPLIRRPGAAWEARAAQI